jgi:hypothetical protein
MKHSLLGLFLFFFAFFFALFFNGCSESENVNAPDASLENISSASVENSLVLSSGVEKDSLSVSTSTTKQTCEENGAFAWVSQGSSYKICENGVWEEYQVSAAKTGFDPCKFNFGAAWQAASEDKEHYAGVDYIAVWLGDNDFYNAFEARMIDMCLEVKATPMIYAYVIAEFGKDHGLSDCDMAKESTHCTHGASLIREFFADSILARYKAYAVGMREQIEFYYSMDPKEFESIWLIEPDFYQYSHSGSEQKVRYDSIAQVGGGIPDSLMGVYFEQIVQVIKQELPKAKIAIDISPWIENPESWYSNFNLDVIEFASTSGGRTLAGSEKIRSGNPMTWKQIAEITGKPILADAGYDKGGKGTGHAQIWDDVSNIKARLADGVIGVMQMDAALDYPKRLDTIRVQLENPLPQCKL